MRSLYDSEYIQSGCDPLLYDEEENVDNSIGTWSTNYAIFAIGLFFVIKLASCPPFHRNTSFDTGDDAHENPKGGAGFGDNVEDLRKKNNRFNIYLILFFAMMALSFGVAGIGHQIATTRSSATRVPMEVTSYLLFDFGNIALMLMLFEMTSVLPAGDTPTWKKIIWYLGIAIGLATAVLTVVMKTLLYAGVLGLLMYIATIVINIVAAAKDGKNAIHYANKVLGAALWISGLLVWVMLRTKCGFSEYDNCFDKCPLPFEFNHNALFHLLYAIGLVVYGWSEDISPSVNMVVENRQDQDEFEA